MPIARKRVVGDLKLHRCAPLCIGAARGVDVYARIPVGRTYGAGEIHGRSVRRKRNDAFVPFCVHFPSTASGRCQSPRSFLRTIQMSLRFMPVISLRFDPVTFSLVVVKYSTSPLNMGEKSERRELKSFAFLTTWRVLLRLSSAARRAPARACRAWLSSGLIFR